MFNLSDLDLQNSTSRLQKSPGHQNMSISSRLRVKLTKRIKSAASRTFSADGVSVATSLANQLGISNRFKDKLLDTLKLVAVALPPIAVVIYLSTMMMVQVGDQLRQTNNLASFMNKSMMLTNLTRSLQRERGMTCILLVGRGGNATGYIGTMRNETDVYINEIEFYWEEMVKLEDKTTQTNLNLSSVEEFQLALRLFRSRVMSGANDSVETCEETMSWYTPRVDIFLYNSGRIFYESKEGAFWGTFDSLRMVMLAGEMIGLKRAYGAVFFASGYFDMTMYRLFVEVSSAVTRYLNLAGSADLEVKTWIAEADASSANLLILIDTMYDMIMANNSVSAGSENELNSIRWFNNMTEYSTSVIDGVKNKVSNKLLGLLITQSEESITLLIIAICSVSAALLICVPITIYYSVQSRRLANKIREKMRELSVEKQKSEQLLFQMMPMSIVKELQAGNTIIPKMYSESTVYFSDVKGFTTICSTSSPLQVVSLLNALYTCMDTVLDQYGVYKVETIGDAYMVVSGIPKSNGREHSAEVATMALHMLKEIANLKVPHRPDIQLRMRIGINTGPCAAGIVGVKMPRYCLFGDTVNTASRMESTGMPMRIQLSHTTSNHISQYHGDKGFTLNLRGERNIKGKGVMRTYWLVAKENFPYKVDLSEPDLDMLKEVEERERESIPADPMTVPMFRGYRMENGKKLYNDHYQRERQKMLNREPS